MTVPTSVRTIVVGVDESDGAASALRWAAREADLHEANVTAVMAWELLHQPHPVVGEHFDPGYGDDDALDALRAFVAAAVPDKAATVETEVVCDLPARALLDAAASADLLVVGARGLGGFRGLLLGSVSHHCLHHTTTPIAIVRGVAESDAQHGRIIVGVDGSDTAQRALRWALEEAHVRNASLDVVNAWQVPSVAYYPHTTNMFDPGAYERASREILDNALAAAGAEDLDVSIRRVSLRGGAAAGILDLAAGVDLVVLGSRGLGAVKGMLLGSVTMQIAHHAPCPVVVVPPAD